MMKKYKKFRLPLAVVAVSMAFSASAFAAELKDAEVSIDADTRVVKISGVHTDGANGTVTVSVSCKQNIYYWSQMQAAEDGRFSFTYTMDENDTPGVYNVIIGGSNISKNVTDSYLSADMEQSIVGDINSATIYTDIESIIGEYGNMFDINIGEGSDFYALSNKSSVWSALMGRGFSLFSDVKAAFDKAVAIESFNEAEKTVEKVVSLTDKFSNVLGIDTGDNSYYKAIKDDNKKIGIAEAVIKKNFSLKDAEAFCKAYNSAAALCVINSMDDTNRDKLISYIEKINNDKIASISLVKYNALSNTTKKEYAIKKVTNGTTYTSLTAFASTFDSACEEAKNYDPYASETPGGNYAGSPGSGGGGGGGNSGGGQSVTITYNPLSGIINEGATTQNKANKFNDISSVSWAMDAINELADKGIISGVGDNRFLPNGNVTRAEFVKMLVGALNIIDNSKNISFNDVNENMWQYKYISAALNAGIVQGISETEFGVNSNITREDMCTMLWRAVNVKGITLSQGNTEAVFSDNSEISGYAKEAITNLNGAGIVNGYEDNSFAPKNTATRAMAAKVIYEVMKEGGIL